MFIFWFDKARIFFMDLRNNFILKVCYSINPIIFCILFFNPIN